jgi:hypothetical protein
LKTKDNPLRNIARFELTRIFNDLAPKTREELETSLVRQWLTYEGHAGVITPLHNAWFRLVRQEDVYHVGRDLCDSRVAAMLRESGADEGEIPKLFHRANLSQHAEFLGSDGKRCRLSIDPRERQVTVGQAPEGDDE